MKVRPCSNRPILEPCSLEGYAYQLDPYIGCEHRCHYCYALNQAETDWAEEILTHQDLIGQLSHELSALEPQPIYIGWNSDAYQLCEGSYQQTRQALELLVARDFSVCILTKSDLVVRDIDLIASMLGSSVGFSIAIQDEHIRQLFEVAAPPNERRVEALRRLREAGIETYVLITPVMPFISDVKALVEMVAPYADCPLSDFIKGCSSDKRSQSFPDEGQDPLLPVGQLVILKSDEAKRAVLAMPGSVWCPAPIACRFARWARGSRTSS